MGGFGALRFAFRHPELFSAVVRPLARDPAREPVRTSPAREPARRWASCEQRRQILEQLFGDPIDMERWKASNPLTPRRDREARTRRSRIYVDCGESDSYGFDESCRAFDEVLTKRNIPHEFAIRPGGHGWEFVQSASPTRPHSSTSI